MIYRNTVAAYVHLSTSFRFSHTITAVRIYIDISIAVFIYIRNSIYVYIHSSVYRSVGVYTYALQYLYIHSRICISVAAFAYSSTVTFTKCTLTLKVRIFINFETDGGAPCIALTLIHHTFTYKHIQSCYSQTTCPL